VDEVARNIIDTNLYMVLATADENGRPWPSPVYYAAEGYREFFWVSAPDATHSRNLGTRRDVGIVIFDSRATIGTGQAVYMTAFAEELSDGRRQRGIDIFSRRSVEHGGNAWTLDDVQPHARLRLYVASAFEHYVLGPEDRRHAVNL
jgi:nitroimidazol reductase NimA-like FMN-containing flavoprotein (pyridoxamine 5'-phosphate oxidase superfamily)